MVIRASGGVVYFPFHDKTSKDYHHKIRNKKVNYYGCIDIDIGI